MSQKRKRRHHIVSRFYLEGFAADGQVQRFSLRDRADHRVATRDATVNKDFYTLELPDGEQSDFFEDLMSQIEGPAVEALQYIAQAQLGELTLSAEQKSSLALWIALQHLRTEGIRNDAARMEAEMIRLVVGVSGKKALRRHIEAVEGPISDARLDAEWADLTQPGGTEISPNVLGHLRQIMDMLGGTANVFASLQWSVNLFTRKTLFTSDHPVVLLPDPDQPRWMGLGLLNAAGYAIPLTRSRGLVIGASPDLPDLVVPGSAKMANILNTGTTLNARSAIFCHPDDADRVRAIELPPAADERAWGPSNDHWIHEDGFFGEVSDDERKRLAKAMPRSPNEKGFSLRDLQWPIPRRRYRWEG